MRNREQFVRPRSEIEAIFDFQKTLGAYERLLSDASARD